MVPEGWVFGKYSMRWFGLGVSHDVAARRWPRKGFLTHKCGEASSSGDWTVEAVGCPLQSLQQANLLAAGRLTWQLSSAVSFSCSLRSGSVPSSTHQEVGAEVSPQCRERVTSTFNLWERLVIGQ